MSDAEKIAKLERSFWEGDAALFEVLLADSCLIAIPGAGLLDRAAVLDSLKGEPRWTSVEFADEALIKAGDCLVFGYRAFAQRGSDDPRRFLCTSTYQRGQDGLKLVQHHQTPDPST